MIVRDFVNDVWFCAFYNVAHFGFYKVTAKRLFLQSVFRYFARKLFCLLKRQREEYAFLTKKLSQIPKNMILPANSTSKKP